MNESLVDKSSLKYKYYTYKKSPYIYNDIKDWIMTLIIYLIFGYLILYIEPLIIRFAAYHIKFKAFVEEKKKEIKYNFNKDHKNGKSQK